MKLFLLLAFILVAAFTAGGLVLPSPATKTVTRTKTVNVSKTQTIYLRNLSPRYMSDKEILNDIPAWEASINKDFAPAWHTTQYKLVFLGRKEAPTGGMIATFIKSGPVRKALAYHTVNKGSPGIVVYTGTGAYYGYDNSVSFTHELQEFAADPTISFTNQGWPYDWVNVVLPDGSYDRRPQIEGTFWATEVSDPVEASSYTRKGLNGKPVAISDFVEPNWFNNAVKGSYDFMDLIQQPFTILPGGYAQFFDGTRWQVVLNFRKGHASDAGFYKGERQERH